jgi:TRAP-type C4-dicarboxylate transport system substrate-binding protein
MPWGPVGAFKLYEVFKHHLNARIDAVAMYTLMNERRYNALPADIRKLFDESRPFFTANWGKWWKDTDTLAIEAAKKAGNKVTDVPDATREAWRAKMKPVTDKYIEEQAKTLANAREIYDAMTAALKKYE